MNLWVDQVYLIRKSLIECGNIDVEKRSEYKEHIYQSNIRDP